MKKRIFRNCMILVLSLTATQAIASAEDDERSGIEGVWIANVTARNCQTGAVVTTIRALNMFIHDGSLTEVGASLAPSPFRSSSVGAWRHAQGHRYTSTFRFFRYNPDGTFLTMAKVTRSIELSGDQFTSVDVTEDFNADNVLVSTRCSTETATRAREED